MSDPISYPAPGIFQLLLEISDCVCRELSEGPVGPVCLCGPVPGLSPAWDGCTGCDNDACGMAYVRLGPVTPYESFPIPEVEGVGCRRPLMYTVVAGALRCMPTPDGGGPLSNQESAEVSVRQWADMWSLYRAIKCCPASLISVGAYQPLGPQGACVGGEWTFWVSLD